MDRSKVFLKAAPLLLFYAHPYPRTKKHAIARISSYTTKPKSPGSFLQRKRKQELRLSSSFQRWNGTWITDHHLPFAGKSQDVPSGAYPEFTLKNGSSLRFSFRGVLVRMPHPRSATVLALARANLGPDTWRAHPRAWVPPGLSFTAGPTFDPNPN